MNEPAEVTKNPWVMKTTYLLELAQRGIHEGQTESDEEAGNSLLSFCVLYLRHRMILVPPEIRPIVEQLKRRRRAA